MLQNLNSLLSTGCHIDKLYKGENALSKSLVATAMAITKQTYKAEQRNYFTSIYVNPSALKSELRKVSQNGSAALDFEYAPMLAGSDIDAFYKKFAGEYLELLPEKPSDPRGYSLREIAEAAKKMVGTTPEDAQEFFGHILSKKYSKALCDLLREET